MRLVTSALVTFWFLVLVGVLLAVALVRPETLEDLPRHLLDYSPRLLIAGSIAITGYAVAAATAGVVGFGLERASGRTVRRVARAVRWTIFSAAVILALAQLGLDTTILVLLTAVLGFGVMLSGALLVGLGGWDVAREIAAGRYFKRFILAGTEIDTGSESGIVVALHPATLELETEDGHRRHIPYSQLLKLGVTIRGAESGRT